MHKIQNTINSRYAYINKLRKEIGSWNRWYNKQPWYKKAWAWVKKSWEISWRGARIGTLYVEIGALYTAKGTALAAL